MGAPGSQPGPGGDRPGPPVELATVPGPAGGGPWCGRLRARSGTSVGHRDHQGGSPPHAPLAAHRRRAPRRSPRRPRRRGQRPARAPVRRVRGQRGPRPRGEGRPVPRRRRPVRLERPAAPLGGAGRRGARPARRGAGPLGPRPGHPRRLRPLVGLPRLRPRGDGGDAPRRTGSSRSSRRTGRGSTSRRSTPSSTGPCSRRSARPHSPLRDLAALGRPAGDLEDRPAPRRDRDPRPDGPRRGRGDRRRDRGHRARLPGARPLARRAGREDARASRTRTRAPRSPSPSTRTRPARCSS